MIKALVSIDVDLAASRTIRFACQLGYFMPVELHPVYIKESPPRELSIGSGWARHHWERELCEGEPPRLLESQVLGLKYENAGPLRSMLPPVERLVLVCPADLLIERHVQ